MNAAGADEIAAHAMKLCGPDDYLDASAACVVAAYTLLRGFGLPRDVVMGFILHGLDVIEEAETAGGAQ